MGETAERAGVRDGAGRAVCMSESSGAGRSPDAVRRLAKRASTVRHRFTVGWYARLPQGRACGRGAPTRYGNFALEEEGGRIAALITAFMQRRREPDTSRDLPEPSQDRNKGDLGGCADVAATPSVHRRRT